MAPYIWLPQCSKSVYFQIVPQLLAGDMVAYDDSKWIEILKGLDLTPKERAAAKLLLFEKGTDFRKVMLSDDNESNKEAIMLALGEYPLGMGCTGEEGWDPVPLCSTLLWSTPCQL